MKRLLTTLLIMGSIAVCFAVADLTGKWTGTLNTDGTDMPVTYTFNATGDKLSGNVLYDSNTFQITDGKVKGDSLLFNVDYNGNSIPHSGRVYPDSIGLNLVLNGTTYHMKLKHAN